MNAAVPSPDSDSLATMPVSSCRLLVWRPVDLASARFFSPDSLVFASQATLPCPDTGLCPSSSPTVKSTGKTSGDFTRIKDVFQYINRTVMAKAYYRHPKKIDKLYCDDAWPQQIK